MLYVGGGRLAIVSSFSLRQVWGTCVRARPEHLPLPCFPYPPPPVWLRKGGGIYTYPLLTFSLFFVYTFNPNLSRNHRSRLFLFFVRWASSQCCPSNDADYYKVRKICHRKCYRNARVTGWHLSASHISSLRLYGPRKKVKSAGLPS